MGKITPKSLKQLERSLGTPSLDNINSNTNAVADIIVSKLMDNKYPRYPVHSKG